MDLDLLLHLTNKRLIRYLEPRDPLVQHFGRILSTSGPAYSLGAQPLYYAPVQGVYVTSADVPAAQGSVNFSNFGFGRRRRRRSRKHRDHGVDVDHVDADHIDAITSQT